MFKRFTAFLMSLVLLTPSLVYAKSDAELLVNESFNSYVTNEVPNLTLTGRGIAVAEYEEKDKGLKFVLNSGEKRVEFAAAPGNRFYISFDLKASGSFGGKVNVKNGTSAFTVLNFEDGNIKTHNNSRLGAAGTSKHNIVICVGLKQKQYDVYMDGKILASEYFAGGMKMTKLTGIEFGFYSDVKSEVVLDNVNVGNGEYTTDMIFPEDDFNEQSSENNAFEKNVTTDTYINCDFSKGARLNATYNNKDNILEDVTDSEGNGYCYFERTGSQDLHLDIQMTDYVSDSLIYEFAIYNESNDSGFTVNFKDKNDKYQTLCSLSAGSVLKMGSDKVTVPLNEWHTVSIVYDRFEQELRGYFDYEAFAEGIATEKTYDPANINVWRFHVGGTGTGEKFRIDNIRVYGGETPSEPVVTENGEQEINISKDMYIWDKDTSERSFMQDKVGYHLRSNILYTNGERSKIATRNINDRLLVPVQLLKTAFGIDTQFDSATGIITLPGGTMKAGSSEATFNGSAVMLNGQPEVVYGEVYIPFRSVCEDLLGKSVYYDNTQVSGGMLIISDTPVENEVKKMDLQKLNDFLFYERPSPERILADYNSSELKGVHPRVLATQEDFDRIKALTATDKNMKDWYGQLLTRADAYLNQPPTFYEIRDGVRLWAVCNEVVESISALALAYKLTGDEKYAERAWADLEAVTEFPNWNPSHHIDVASMAIAYSIGYDWLYDWLTPERREIMEKGIYSQAFYDYNLSYQSGRSLMGEGVIYGNNHNAVMNGGAVMMSMAFMDVYPELCSYFTSSAIRCAEYMAWHFAPEGSWYEGTSYGIMTLRFYAYELSPLDMILGQTYSLGNVEGMNNAANVVVTMQSDIGAFRYSDHSGGSGTEYDPGVTWFANYYGDTQTPACWYNSFKQSFGADDQLVRTMLWYKPEFSESVSGFKRDYLYPVTDVVTFRDDWSKDALSLVGLKGGKPNVDHGHMDIGTFTFFTDGVEWATDMGYEDYNLPQYWSGSTAEDTRWTYFRLRGEAHNCLVIDPEYKGEFDANAQADVVRFESKDRGAIAVVDMTDSYGKKKVTKARRGFFYTDDRRSLVVRDEVELNRNSELNWFMITDKNVEIDGDSVILTDKTDENIKLRIDFATSGKFTLSAGIPEPLKTSPNPSGLKDNSAYTRIRLVMDAEGTAAITAKLTPLSWGLAAPVEDFDKSIDAWEIPDGEKTEKAHIEEIMIDGVTYALSSTDMKYFCGQDEVEVPEISAYSDKYAVSVQKAAGFADKTLITVSDKEYPQNKTVYSIGFEQMKNTGYEGVTELTVRTVSASAEPQPVNNVFNVLDRDLSTRWSSDMTESVTVDLGSVQSFDKVIMAFYNGSSRKYNLAIEVSDGGEYHSVFNGTSSGAADGYEAFDIGECNARYIKITGRNGSSANTWNSWTELAVAKTN